MNQIKQFEEDIKEAKELYKSYLNGMNDLSYYLITNLEIYEEIKEYFYTPSNNNTLLSVLEIIDAYSCIDRSWNEYYCCCNMFFQNEGICINDGVLKYKIIHVMTFAYEIFLLLNPYNCNVEDIK